jgi:glycosyltransferase involved in cell wall biosynthesis
MRPTVLHVIDTLGTGGAQRRLFNDLRHFGPRFEHRVCTLFGETDSFGSEVADLGIPVTCLGLGRLADLPLGVARLASWLRRERRIALVHSQLFNADTVARPASVLTGRPVVSTTQAAIYEPDSGLNSTWRRMVDRVSGRAVRRFVAVSSFVRRSLCTRLAVPWERVTVIPNSVDVARVTPDPVRRRQTRTRLGLADDAFAWITVGRLNAPKGYQFLIEAMALVVGRRPDTRLLLVGSGPDQAALEAISRAHGLNGAVQFMGDRGDVVDLLDAADGFVFPSVSEGLPLALLEAMAMEKPCVASRIGPHEELIEHARSGVLVTPRAVGELAEGMVFVQADATRGRALGREARARAARDFEASRCAHALEDLYAGVVG